jgi:hypothetical protein
VHGRSGEGRGAVRWLLVLAAAALVLAGCGSSDGGAATTTTAVRDAGSKPTEADAERLARMLYDNHRGGGATFTASADYSDAVSVALDGEVDWSGGSGTFSATSTFADGRPQETQDVIYTEDAVYTEATPQQANVLAQQGHPGIRWIERAPDLEQRPLDQVIDLVASLAAPRPDNPRLVVQGELRFDRQEQVEGSTTDVFTSPTATYGLASDTGRLVRFQGTLPGFAGPVVVDLGPAKAVEVTVPAEATVADASLLEAS